MSISNNSTGLRTGVCTSTFRPLTPYEGQMIYETDTDRVLVWNNSAWVIVGPMTFTTEAVRDAAITSPSEGMVAYLTAPTVPAATGNLSTSVPTGITTIYNGTVWVCTSSVGAASTSASQTFTTSYADLVHGGTVVTVTLTTGTTAEVSFYGRIAGNGNFAFISVKSGTVAASDGWGANFTVTSHYGTVGRTFVMTGLTAGTNTFTLQGKNNVAGGSCDQTSLLVRGIA